MAPLKGTLDFLVLTALSSGPMYRFEIANWLEDRFDCRLTIVDAALLQALHRRAISPRLGARVAGGRPLIAPWRPVSDAAVNRQSAQFRPSRP